MILAKSDGTTLEQHIEDCLIVRTQLMSALPTLPAITSLSRFWDILFAAVYLHDFGKSQKEFQKVLLKKSNTWERQRHELYSVPFVDKLDLNKKDRDLIKRAVLGHHKDFYTLYSEYWKNDETLVFEFRQKWKRKGLKAHPADFNYNLRARLQISDLQKIIAGFEDIARQHNIAHVHLNNKISLADQPHPYKSIAKTERGYDYDSAAYLQNLLLWGSLKICDHYGSAGVKRIHILNDNHFSFLDSLEADLAQKGADFYEHQKTCFQKKGNCILIAPTGSGKTESAIGWLREEIKKHQGRVFYVLPYTASINAMHKRLSLKMDNVSETELSEIVGVQHGNLPPYLARYVDQIAEIKTTRERNARIKILKEQFRRIEHPIKITTPFQLLKYFYGVKGFEMGLAQLAGAKIIFDEIHAYDAITFAQILVMLKVLSSRFRCSVLVMTATLPSFMLQELKTALNVKNEIRADDEFLKSNIRHSIHLIEKSIEDIFPEVKSFLNDNKRIIIVCNTVQRAQAVFDTLQNDIDIASASIALLHGRFNAMDRLKNEARAFEKKTKILIGTQAIEVSLDIDYDVMFTEPAPLDALLQRFGRINRMSKNAPCPIFICKIGGPNDKYIYPPEIVKKTLDVLQDIDVLREQQIQELLDRVYPDWLPDQKKDFVRTKKAFQDSFVSLQPYSANKEREQDFYEKFTGIKVLPAQFLLDYKELIEKFDFIRAEQLLVNIHHGMYFKLKQNPEGSQIEMRIIDVIRDDDKIERHYITVAKCKYDHSKGMTDEYEDIREDVCL